MCFLLFSAPGLVLAQSYDNPGLGQQPVVAHPQDFKPLGVRAGSFMLHPGVELAAEWHDNILYTSEYELSDTIFHVRPYITAQSNWNNHSLNVRLAADIARYSDYGVRDYEDIFFLVNGRLDVTSRSYFSYSLDYMDLHEERSFRGAEQGIEPTTYDLLGGSLGYDHTFNRLSIGALYDMRQLRYDNSVDLLGDVIDNSDRDRDMDRLGLRMGYQFQTDMQAFARVGWNGTDYKQVTDRNDYYRSSEGFSAGAGLDFQMTGVLSGDVSVDYRETDYDDPLLPTVTGWGLGAGLQWYPTTLTSVHGRILTSIEDTTQASASGYFRTLYSVRVNHELMRNLQLNGIVSYTDHDYQLVYDAPAGSRDNDKYWNAGLGATYFFNRSIWMSASYNWSDLSSNVDYDDFTANRFWLVVGFEK